MRYVLTNAKVVLPHRILDGTVVVVEGKIFAIEQGTVQLQGHQIDLQGLYLAPGFVEIHTHGAGGCDFMDGTLNAFVTASRTHFEHGVTTLLPTALAATREEILRSIDGFRKAREALVNGPYLPGLHMEGPYLNVQQKGAIDEKYIREPDPVEYEEFLEYGKGAIARWTVAPELKGALSFGDRLMREGILPSIGHSNADFWQVQEAFHHGFTHVTHLYSAMSTIVRKSGFRYPGVLESAFILPDMTVELIADGCHLPAELLEMVYRLKGVEKVCLTCDSMRCAGQDVQESILGSLEKGQRVIIEDDVAKLPDRSAFAGSIATTDRLVRVMVQQAGISLQDSVRMLTLTPANIIGLGHKKGSIAVGKDADLICFDQNINIKGTLFGGRPVSGIFLNKGVV